MKRYSIKQRLISSVLLVELLSALCISGIALIYERHSHFRAFDVMLRGRADSLLGAVQDAEDEQDNVMLDGSEASLPKRDIYEVWDQNLRVLGKSPNWDGVGPSQLTAHNGRPTDVVQGRRHYRVIRVDGVRNVDPGDAKGGIPRAVIIVYGSPTEPVWHAIWTTVEFYAITSAILLALTGAIMFWLLRESLAPLKELAEEAAKVSITSWGFRPTERMLKTVELAPLATALETALKGLEQSFLQQRRFLGDAAHELKTGVAVVKSSLQLLMLKTRTTEEYLAGLERCQIDCERMQNIVAEMLTLSKLEDDSTRAETGLSAAKADITTVAQDVLQQFSSMAEINGIPVAMSAPSSLLLPMEEKELHLLCSNLVLNALQHSDSKGEVRIVAESDNDWAELQVIDSGAGIDPEAQPHIFERFYRGDSSRSRRTGGTGLGLAICAAIVQKYRGTIQVTSELGKGTIVRVRLPLVSRSIAGPSVV